MGLVGPRVCKSQLMFEPFADQFLVCVNLQVILLEEAWSELFVLCAIQWCMPMESCPLFSTSEHAHNINSMKACNVLSDIRILQEVMSRYKAINVDPAEFACIKAVILFKGGNRDLKIFPLLERDYCASNAFCRFADARGLKDPQQVENLQDQAQVMLGQHVRTQHPAQPVRFVRRKWVLLSWGLSSSSRL